MRNAIVLLQIATMIGLGYLFAKDGNYRLAGAQGLYCIATALLFLGKAS